MNANKKSELYSSPGISMVEKMAADLIALNQKLQESETARGNMLSNVSHDLRAPLTAIRSAIDRLFDQQTSEEEKCKLLSMLDRRVTVLENMVTELHYAMTLDLPKFSLRLSRLDIAPLLEEYYISQDLSGIFHERKFILAMPAEFSAFVNVDPLHFLRILDNLVSNALKHTENNDTIELGCHHRGNLLEIHLSDTGTGIHPKDLPYIFHRTYTSSQSRTPGYTGGGLGLHIAKSLVEKHGGTICCASEPGKGACFTITLPFS